MPHPLETATNPASLNRVVIEPVSRVEGHGKVTLLLDDDRKVKQARLHIVEFRGFERFIQGRPYWEVPTLVQRLCGICPVSHLLAASKACDAFVIGHADAVKGAARDTLKSMFVYAANQNGLLREFRVPGSERCLRRGVRRDRRPDRERGHEGKPRAAHATPPRRQMRPLSGHAMGKTRSGHPSRRSRDTPAPGIRRHHRDPLRQSQ